MTIPDNTDSTETPLVQEAEFTLTQADLAAGVEFLIADHAELTQEIADGTAPNAVLSVLMGDVLDDIEELSKVIFGLPQGDSEEDPNEEDKAPTRPTGVYIAKRNFD